MRRLAVSALMAAALPGLIGFAGGAATAGPSPARVCPSST